MMWIIMEAVAILALSTLLVMLVVLPFVLIYRVWRLRRAK